LAGIIAPTSHGYKYKKKFDKIFPDLAKKFNLKFITFLLDGVAMRPDFNLSDGIHPNEKGTIIISRTLEKIILKTYKKNTNQSG
jgi:acyl-CoA thioesterase-1